MRLNQLLRFLEESPEDPFLLFALAKEYENLDEPPQALAYYLQLVENNPGYVATYYHLGKLYERMEDFEAARKAYAQGQEAARQAGDRHAFGELSGALDALEG